MPNYSPLLMLQGLASALPASGSTDTHQAVGYYATDTQVLYLWNGSAWVLLSVPWANPNTISGTITMANTAENYLLAGPITITSAGTLSAATGVNLAIV